MDAISPADIDVFYGTIGKNVMQLRKEKGLSQLNLALAIRLKSVGLISVAELNHNKKHFNLEHLYKITNDLDVKITNFFSDID